MDRVLIMIFFLAATVLAIAVIDFKKLYIPNRLNFLFLVEAIFYRGLDIEAGILGAGAYTLPLLIFYGYGSDIAGKDVIGFGDIKFMIGAGYLLGYTDFYDIYFFYLVSFVTGALYGIFLLVKNKRKSSEMPFAPFLITGLCWMIWGRV